MKKIIIATLVLTLFLVGCDADTVSTSSSNTSPSTEAAQEEDNSIVILDKDGIKVTYTGITLVHYLPDQPNGYMLNVELLVENNSEADITIYPVESTVNDVMKTAVSGLPLTALSGKKAVTAFSFANLEGTGIESADDTDKVDKIEFQLSVVDNDTYKDVFKSDVITINP